MRLRLAAVYAHPDDDTNGIAGILALERERVDYSLIVATSGEAGEIADPALATRESLAEVRELEELRSLEAIGLETPEVHFLRYPDGGLDAAPREELIERVASILRAFRPHVVFTFGPDGITRHSDHVTIGEVASEAFHRIRGEGSTEDSSVWLLHNALPESLLERFWAALRERGREVDPAAPFMPQGVPDGDISVRVDIRPAMDLKMAAIAAHRTQAFEFIPKDLRRDAFSAEHFVRAWPPAGGPRPAWLPQSFEFLGDPAPRGPAQALDP